MFDSIATLITALGGVVASIVTYFVTKKQTEGRKADSDTITIENAERITSIYKTQIDELTKRLNKLESDFLELKRANLECNANCMELQHENERLMVENKELKNDYDRLKDVCDKLSIAVDYNARRITANEN